jgi:hypothetical protein
MNGINRNAALFIAGAFYQWLRNNGELGRWVLEAVSLGTSSVSEDLEAVEESLPRSGPFEMGRTAGDLAGIVTGVLEMIAGGGAVAGGGSLCLTGIGCIAGAPATVVGGATAVHGGSVVIEGTGNIAEDFAGLVSQVFAISGGGEGNGGDTNDINWEWKSKPTFGHTFNRHGAGKKKTQRLRGRAATESQPQGQWLNNEEAAEFLRSIYPDISEATIVNIPEGLGQIIMPDGSIIPASRAWVIPRRGGVYTTAYPTLDTL